MSRILVTGGAGYVGSRLVPELLKQNHQVRVFDWLFFEPMVFDQFKNEPNLEVIRGDLRDASAVEAALEGIKDVIHLACLSNDPSCDLDENLTRSINYGAGVQLIELAKRQGIRRFFFPSSASVYGIKETPDVTEASSLDPITSYAYYKVKIEEFLQQELTPTFSAVMLRPATLCGYAPRQRLDLTVNILTYQAVCLGKMTVFGGEQQRPNLTIQDMVDLYLLLLQTPLEQIHGEVFNVTAENYKVIEIAHIVRETLDLPVEIDIIQTNDQRSYHMSAEKIKHQLGYMPRYGIHDAIKELAQALRSGQIPDPTSAKYRNVQFLKEYQATWARRG